MNVAEEKLFQHLLIYNSTRGLDSTGAGAVKRHEVNGVPRMVVAKELGHPFELLLRKRKNEDDIDSVLSATNKVLLGHCRAKTIGSSTRYNAHPFKFDKLMGTHNGTLSYQTQESLEGNKKFETDSQAFFYEVAEHGIAAAVKKLRRPREDEKQGFGWTDAYAFVWYDASDNTVNFLRNQERPLYYGWTKDRQRLFWSSDYGHLYTAMQSVPHEDKDYIYNLQPDIHLSWEVPNHGQQFGKARVVKREATPDVPLGRGVSLLTGSHSRHQNNGSNGTHNTPSKTWKDDNGPEPWMDDLSGFWECFFPGRYAMMYATFKSGPYYNSKQECWDSLTEMEQHARVKRGLYPSGINIYKKIGNPKELNDKLDNSEERVVGYLGKPSTSGEHQKESPEKIRARVRNDRFEREGHVVTGLVPVWENENKKVFWDKNERKWVYFSFLGYKVVPPAQSWMRTTCDNVPEWVPFTDHDVNARHFFRHIGKKKKKKTFFRGFNGKDLSPEEFNQKMEEGCLNCTRKPKWGNWVHFLNENFFVCEHCEKDSELVKSFKTGTKQ